MNNWIDWWLRGGVFDIWPHDWTRNEWAAFAAGQAAGLKVRLDATRKKSK